MELEVAKGNRIIEKIHSDFFSMDEKTDTRVQKELKIAYDEERKEINSKLSDIGFGNASSADVFKPENVEANEELNDLLNEYAISYPGYKFITDENITKLCKKYNLFLTTPDRFIGAIPAKNQKDIADFKGKSDDVMHFIIPDEKTIKHIKNALSSGHHITDIIRHYFNGSRSTTVQSMIYILTLANSYPSFVQLQDYHKRKAEQNIKYIEPNFNMKFTAASEYFIAATTDLLDTKGLTADDDTHKMTINSPNPADLKAVEVPDPIVFKKVKRGAIIITAWGPEASDPEVVNINNN